MKIRKDSRPLPIHIFAVAFLMASVIAFVDGLWGIAAHQDLLRSNMPELDWSEDAVIVMLSARLSIAFIPVTLVWLFASKIARWLVTVMGLGKLVNVPDAIQIAADGKAVDPLWIASLILSLLAISMLFLRSSNRWFVQREEVDPATFA